MTPVKVYNYSYIALLRENVVPGMMGMATYLHHPAPKRRRLLIVGLSSISLTAPEHGQVTVQHEPGSHKQTVSLSSLTAT